MHVYTCTWNCTYVWVWHTQLYTFLCMPFGKLALVELQNMVFLSKIIFRNANNSKNHPRKITKKYNYNVQNLYVFNTKNHKKKTSSKISHTPLTQVGVVQAEGALPTCSQCGGGIRLPQPNTFCGSTCVFTALSMSTATGPSALLTHRFRSLPTGRRRRGGREGGREEREMVLNNSPSARLRDVL